MRETFADWWSQIPPAEEPPTIKDLEDANVIKVANCACETPIYMFAKSKRQPQGRCSYCIERSKLEAQIERSLSGDPAPTRKISSILGEVLELLHAEHIDGEHGLYVVLHCRFLDEPLLPIFRVSTGAREVVQALKALQLPAVVGLTQVGRAYRLVLA